MSPFNRYVRRVFLGTLSLILFIAGTFLLAGQGTWARGAALGGAASLMNLVIMAGDVRRQGSAAQAGVFQPGRARYALRMGITAGALIYAATNQHVSLWATIPFLFAAQLAMTCGELMRSREQDTS